MLFKNQYTMLKKVNDMSVKTLSAENRAALKEISCYLLYMTWNCYEIERIRKDMIEIAARCELEGRTLREEIGGDTAQFLLEMAPDLPGHAAGLCVHLVSPMVWGFHPLIPADGSASRQPTAQFDANNGRPFPLYDFSCHLGLVSTYGTENQNPLWLQSASSMAFAYAGSLLGCLDSTLLLHYSAVSRYHQRCGRRAL